MAVHHEHGHGSTTVVETDREGPATALVVLIALIIVGALIWFFAFSGVVFDRSSGDSSPDVNIQNPPAQQDAPDTVTNNNTNNNPVPTSS